MTRDRRAIVHEDAAFARYAERGACHWREVGRGLIARNAFTAERHRLRVRPRLVMMQIVVAEKTPR